MLYRVFPPIGISRLGRSSDFLLCPEVPGSGPVELNSDGTTSNPTRYKSTDKTQIRKVAARFHIFESTDGKVWQPASLPTTAVIEWKVHLINKKSAVKRPSAPPTSPQRPIPDPTRSSQLIDPGPTSISGASNTSAPVVGTFKVGSFITNVQIGQLKTDSNARLIVLGGSGVSSAPAGTDLGNSFYNNPNWHDDVCDGPVTATIRMSPTSGAIDVDGAWVVVAPPDYAPEVGGLVTLYDVIRQVGIDKFGLMLPAQPNYDLDIAPIIERTKRLRWVHEDATWSNPALSVPELRSNNAANKDKRKAAMELIQSAEDIFRGHIQAAGPRFKLRQAQVDSLSAWVQGNCDLTAATHPSSPTAQGLTQAALESAVGQGFCPGIEAGIIVLDPTLYRTPFDFRINHASVSAGDITALMAQPWQADFLKCNTVWWPTQRPDIAPQSDSSHKDWMRSVDDHKELVEKANQLGIIARQADGSFLEVERDPTLPP